METTPQPTALTVHQASRVLEIGFDDGRTFRIPFELMRVYSPSAEVQGHGPGQEVLQTGKREVEIVEITPVGHYAVQPRFSDGHDTGIFSWRALVLAMVDFCTAVAVPRERRFVLDAPMVKAGGGSACSSH